MKDNSSVHTRFAMTLALLRAMEAYRPEQERLFDDRFSRGFLPGWWVIYLLPGLRNAHMISIESSAPGFIGGLYGRTAYIDQCLCAALERGCGQVVILGAGFDARAYRIPGIQEKRVFELDLPEAQHTKQARLVKVLGALPAHVTFVPIDFDRQELDGALTEAGWRAGLRSFFIWEGVTQYIQPAAVERTLATIGSMASSGSELVFTYAPRGVVDGTKRTRADQKIVSGANQIGMPWVTGLAPEELGDYLREKGFDLIEQVGAAEYQTRFIKPRQRYLKVFKTERTALAAVR